ncbi:unnamed protein product [Rangifer tarandus platyrhynchus]|uniref:Uncharacterized protein n=2 Tax=Rangifer tarandus platyrhynchus TaxID=3082113 RepID=A0AC59ZSD3_RANTA|nr:unnamed protein product [Rangifer tarandus platyrhynchus]
MGTPGAEEASTSQNVGDAETRLTRLATSGGFRCGWHSSCFKALTLVIPEPQPPTRRRKTETPQREATLGVRGVHPSLPHSQGSRDGPGTRTVSPSTSGAGSRDPGGSQGGPQRGWVGWGLRGGRAPGLVKWVWGHLNRVSVWYPEENRHAAGGRVCRPLGLMEGLGSRGPPWGGYGSRGSPGAVWGVGCGRSDAQPPGPQLFEH